ncbi:MAG: DUF3179 domain-containing protein [Anaerolineales bacterium]|nr:DUF3179 domain-containing protein [Anaerolineales bacterium]
MKLTISISTLILLGVFAAACAPALGATENNTDEPDEVEYEIVTLLPKDAIPSIDNPQFYDVEEADKEYAPKEQVLGVIFEGEARAYSTNMLSRHEIVNDVVAGHSIAVTW